MEFKTFDALGEALFGIPPDAPPSKRLTRAEKRMIRNARFCERHKGYTPPDFGHNPIYSTGTPNGNKRGKGYGGISAEIAPRRDTPPFTIYELPPTRRIDHRLRQFRKTRRSPFDHALFNGIRVK